jgi:hypothetical protein
MPLFDEPSRQPLPQRTFEDVKYVGRKGIASMIPFAGGTLSELLGLLSTPVSQRRDDWFTDLERRLKELETKVKGFHFDDLSQNEVFVSAILIATQGALRTHEAKKLEALKNAVLNVALGVDVNVNRQVQFLSWVDQFTTTHLVVLQLFGSPLAYYNATGQTGPLVAGGDHLASEFIFTAIPRLKEELRSSLDKRQASAHQFIESVLDDLQSKRLLSLIRVNETWAVRQQRPGPASEIPPVITHLGEDFLTFITEPAEGDRL